MRFIVLRSLTIEGGKIILEGLVSLTQKSSGVVAIWADFSKIITNWITPEKSDLLSFEDKDQLEENLELWQIAAENVAILGVDPEENVNLPE